MGINKNNILGMNILANLRLHKINQNQLSTNVNIDKSTISRYISGKASITREHLDKIAFFFNTTPEALLHGDFSNISGEFKNPENLFIYCSMLFPLTMDYSAYKNPHYKTAFDTHKLLFDHLAKLDYNIFAEVDTDKIIDEYLLAMEDEEIKLVSLANLFSVFFIFTVFWKSFVLYSSCDYNNLPYLAKKYITLKEHQDIQSDLADSESEYRSMVNDPEFIPEILDQLGKLKDDEAWSDLADYYICLLFVFGLFPNGFSDLQNKEFGFELLAIFSACGNQFADNYISKLVTTE